MTTEEKSKAYDEAIERAKKHCADYVVETIFPELKESEDDKIRKEIIKYFKKYQALSLGDYNVQDILAWIEKQGKTFTKKDINDAYLKGVCDTKQELEKQGEHQHLNDNFPSFDKAQGTVIVEKQSEQNLIMAKSPQLGEQKPAENKGMNLVEEEMTPFQKKVFCIIDTAIEEEQGLKQVCDKLFALASNEIKQNPAKWSEEDGEILDGIIVDVEVLKEQDRTKDGKAAYQKEIDWLKSLRPQTTWKPSDEQMEALNTCLIKGEISYVGQGYILQSLYDKLKTL